MTNDDTAYATGALPPSLPPSRSISSWRIDNTGVVGWQRTYSPSSAYDSWGVCLTADSTGAMVFVAGATETAYGKDIVVLAYDAAGTLLWQKGYSNAGVNGDDVPVQILTDGTYVYVAGDSVGGSQFGSSTGSDFIVFKLNALTGASAWGSQSNGSPIAARYNGPANGADTVCEMALLNGGGGITDIYVAGTCLAVGAAGTDYAIVRVDAFNPAAITSERTKMTGNETCTSMVLGGGQVFLTGFATTTGGTIDYVTWAFSLGLVVNVNWGPSGAVFDGGQGGSDYARKIVYSGSDQTVIVTGESWRGTAAKFDIATTKLSGFNGATAWTSPASFFNNTAGDGDDTPSDMVIDKCGSVYIGGLTLNGSTIDYVAVSYKPDGTIRWEEQIGGVPTGRQYITHDGPGSSKDYAAAIRVALEGGGLVNHAGDVFLFGVVTAAGGAQKYGVARWDQIDPCPPPGEDPDCCN